MKRSTLIFTGFLGALLLATGCTSIRASQDYKQGITFSEMKTYGWKTVKQKATGDVRIDNPLIDQRIRTAVDKVLTAKGYSLSASRPDVLVAYTYTIRPKINGSSGGPVIGFGFGMGGRRSAVGISSGLGTDVEQVDEGQLVIDLSDGITGDLLWRGTSTSRVDTQATPEKTTTFFNSMVEKNLGQFPPEKK